MAESMQGGFRSTAFEYRPALDGLRALAVYMVLGFHSELGLLSDGFVGVDLFFVLSGYLVTGVLLSEFETEGSISLGRFYERRVRRLLPAALVLVAAVVVSAVLVAPTVERSSLVSDARAALLYHANWHFLVASQDYFAASAESSPLLHFWSLAIEEQFYVVFPILLIVLLKWTGHRGRLGLAFGVLLLLGVLRQIQVASNNQGAAYYATDARLYQILAGVVLAVFGVRWVGTRLAFIAGWSGAAGLLLLASGQLDLSVSATGLVATCASVILITGLDARRSGWLPRALGADLPRYLGTLSYGTYLWHWPVIVVIARYVTMPAAALAALVALLSTGLAAISAQVIERPLRRRSPHASRAARTEPVASLRVIVIGVGASALLALVVAPGLLRSQRAPVVEAVTPPPVIEIDGEGELQAQLDAQVADLVSVLSWPDFDGEHADWYADPECGQYELCRVREGAPEILVFGDSNSLMWLPALEVIADRRGLGLSISWSGGCPWQFGLIASDRTSTCPDAQQRFLDDLEVVEPEIVVLIHVAFTDPKLRRAGFETGGAQLAAGDLPIALQQLTGKALDRYTEGGRDVAIIEPIPVGRYGADCLDKAVRDCTFLRSEEPLTEELVYRYEAMASDLVRVVSMDDLVCPESPTCTPVVDGLVVSIDGYHLTKSFVESIAPQLEARLQEQGVLQEL